MNFIHPNKEDNVHLQLKLKKHLINTAKKNYYDFKYDKLGDATGAQAQ